MPAAELQRQVLGAEALEVEVFGLGGLLLEEEEVEGLRPGGHGFLLLEEDLVVGPVDVGHEVGPLDGVVLVEDAAPHDVEHCVGEVPDVAATVGGELQAVAGGYERHEPFGALFDVGEHRLLQGRGRLEVGLELDDPADGLAKLGHHHPVLTALGGQFEVALHEVGPALGFDVGFRLDGCTFLEGVQLAGREEHLGGVQSHGPHDVGLEGFAGLGLVGDDGAEGIQAEGAAFQLTFLVGVDQVAAAALEPFRHAVGEHVLDAVEDADPDGRGCRGLEPSLAHEAVALAGGPLVAEGQVEVVVVLLEDDLVAVSVLVEVALNAVHPLILLGEGLPQDAAILSLHEDQGLAAGGLRRLRDLVVGVVGEERVVAVDPTGGQSAVARQKHPVIRVAHDAHEERAHLVDVADLVVRLSVQRHFLPHGGGLGGLVGLLPKEYGFTGRRFAHFNFTIEDGVAGRLL